MDKLRDQLANLAALLAVRSYPATAEVLRHARRVLEAEDRVPEDERAGNLGPVLEHLEGIHKRIAGGPSPLHEQARNM